MNIQEFERLAQRLHCRGWRDLQLLSQGIQFGPAVPTSWHVDDPVLLVTLTDMVPKLIELWKAAKGAHARGEAVDTLAGPLAALEQP